jgi:hypothetical protein
MKLTAENLDYAGYRPIREVKGIKPPDYFQEVIDKQQTRKTAMAEPEVETTPYEDEAPL